MINDVQLAALSNWLGSLGMVLIVVYHVSVQFSIYPFTGAEAEGRLNLQLFSVNAKRIEARNNAAATAARGGSVVR